VEGLSSTIAVEGGDGMAKRVAELMVEVLSGAGVKRVYGVSGDSLNGFTDAIRSLKQLQWTTCSA
jgi:pyruvate dehydrogenase (quinone)